MSSLWLSRGWKKKKGHLEGWGSGIQRCISARLTAAIGQSSRADVLLIGFNIFYVNVARVQRVLVVLGQVARVNDQLEAP